MLLSINMWIGQIKLTILLSLLANNLSWGSECRSGLFDCGDNQCVPVFYRCDGDADCDNREDERGCGKEEESTDCAPGALKCEDGSRCLYVSSYCDGVKDCNDGSDEKRCGNETEECNGFKCENLCLPEENWCDGKEDCDDGSDEKLCSGGNETEECNGFKCKNLCIPEEFRCDGEEDCNDGSDEKFCPGDDPCKNMHCSQLCQNTAKGPQCYCNDGYELDEDDKTCIDIDECKKEGFCSHECLNTVGGYNCTCQEGYELIKRTCRARGADPLLIFSTNKEIRGIRLRSDQSFIIESEKTQFTAVDIDVNNERIYGIELSNGSSIYSVKTDGSDFKTVLREGLLTPEDIAIDYIANNIYITDSGLRQILVFKIDGTMCYVLHETNVDKPHSVALDTKEGLMYWSDWSEQLPSISKSGMDGSMYVTLVNSSIVEPTGIAIDRITNRLYWADVKLNTIAFVTLDGSLRKVVFHTRLFHAYSLAVFEDDLYWSDGTRSSLESCNKFNCRKKTIVPNEAGIRVIGVQVYHPVLKQNGSNPCLVSNCSHMCLMSPVNGFQCVCPRGFNLSTDQKTCLADPCESMGCSQYCQNTTEGPQCHCDVGYILDEKDNKTCNGPIVCHAEEMLCPLSDRCIPQIWFCDGNVDCPGGIDEENCTESKQIVTSIRVDDEENEFLFVSDGPTVLVQEYANGSESEKFNFFLGSATVTGLTYDCKSKRLFVSDVNKPAIYAVSLTSLHVRNLVINNITYPEDIAFDWMSNNLYWVDSTKRTVEVVSVDNHRRIILLKDLARPMSLALASYSGFMFIATIGDEDCVSMYAMDGTNRKILYSVQGFPISLALHPSKPILYWADSRAGIISYVNYSSSRSPWILKSGIDGLMSVAVSEENMYWTANGELQSDIGDRVHVLRVSGQENVTVWRRIAYSSGKRFSGKSECLIKNGGCSFLCLTSPSGRACKCSSTMTLAEDGETCSGKKCEENDFQCFDGQCIPSDMKCDENVDCNDGSDEMDCSEQISRIPSENETLGHVTLQSEVDSETLPLFRLATESNVENRA